MKKLLVTTLCVLSSITLFAQIDVKKEELYEYQGVVTIPNKSSSELYALCKLWMAEKFQTTINDVYFDDSGINTYLIKCQYECFYGSYGHIRLFLTFQIDCKDNKFRYTTKITNVQDVNDPTNKYGHPMTLIRANSTPFATENRRLISMHINSLITSLQLFAQKPLPAKEMW